MLIIDVIAWLIWCKCVHGFAYYYQFGFGNCKLFVSPFESIDSICISIIRRFYLLLHFQLVRRFLLMSRTLNAWTRFCCKKNKIFCCKVSNWRIFSVNLVTCVCIWKGMTKLTWVPFCLHEIQRAWRQNDRKRTNKYTNTETTHKPADEKLELNQFVCLIQARDEKAILRFWRCKAVWFGLFAQWIRLDALK